jgi:hypothetical protein
MFDKAREWLTNRWGTSTTPVAEASGAKRDPKKVQIKKVGQALKGSGGGEFESSSVDLDEITRAYNTDSYITRAVNKYAELILKEGWDFSGKNEAATEYIWMRLKLMEEATDKSTDDFFREIAMDLVLYGNAFVVKARQKSGGSVAGVKAVGYTGNQPVAGYFVLPPTTINISRDETGKILKFQQDVGGGSSIDIKVEDMIHFAYKKPRGRAYGIPYIFPVLDDVKMLRQIEENVARLVYRNLFPLYQYQVGIDKPGFEATDEEIEDIREAIRDMPMDGGIVVPERHNISVVSNGGAALDANPYLLYFRQRVFSGLAVSDIVMGIGDTANRGTADNLSAEMIDGVKEFQAIFRNVIQLKIVNELLFEGGFDPVINVDDEVLFEFAEIELDAKIKKENHAVQLFVQNAVTHEELRALMGLDPVTDEGRLYFNMVTIPIAVQTAEASAAASASTDAANNAGSNKDQPANQNGKKTSPGNPKRSSSAVEEGVEDESIIIEEEFSSKVLTEDTQRVNLLSELRITSTTESLQKTWNAFRDDVVAMTKQGKSKEQIQAFVIHLAKQTLRSQIENNLTQAFYLGLSHGRAAVNGTNLSNDTYLQLDKVKKIASSFTDRLANDMRDLILKAIENEDTVERISLITGAFNSNSYRIQFISKTELYRTYNYGLALVAKAAKLESVAVYNDNPECLSCVEKAKDSVDLNSDSLLDAIPPHHPNCTCTIQLNINSSEGGAG